MDGLFSARIHSTHGAVRWRSRECLVQLTKQNRTSTRTKVLPPLMKKAALRTYRQNVNLIHSHVMYRGENLSVYNFKVTGKLSTKFIMEKVNLCWYLESGSGTVRVQCNLGHILARNTENGIETRYFYSSPNTSIIHSPSIRVSGLKSLARMRRLIDSGQPIEEWLMLFKKNGLCFL